jgi:putative endonuclease
MLIQKGGCVYIITNKRHTVLYTGVTSDLPDRIKKHKEKFYPKSFTAKYNCDKLVWFETFSQIEEAIDREKQIKAGSREKKIQLINALNPEWKDLWEADVQFW